MSALDKIVCECYWFFMDFIGFFIASGNFQNLLPHVLLQYLEANIQGQEKKARCSYWAIFSLFYLEFWHFLTDIGEYHMFVICNFAILFFYSLVNLLLPLNYLWAIDSSNALYIIFHLESPAVRFFVLTLLFGSQRIYK